MKSLYDQESRTIMKNAEKASGFGSNRIEQIRDFAKAAQYKKIGIAHCITFGSESEILSKYLSEDFEVVSIDCKHGRLRDSDLFEGGRGRVLCNPAGQAEYLNQRNTDLNLSVGLCVGHDVIFNNKSEAPVTSLFTKDFSTNHNPAQAVSEISHQLG